jgi:hypothetical protein
MNNIQDLDGRFIAPIDPRFLYFSLSLVATWLGYQPDNFRRLCKREGIPIKYPSSGRKAVVNYGDVIAYVDSCDGLTEQQKAIKVRQLERGRSI